MRKRTLIASLCLIAPTLSLAADKPAADAKVDPADLGYSYGYTFGERLKGTLPTLDIENFTRGLQDVYADREARVSREEMDKLMQAAQAAMMKEQETVRRELAEKNAAAGSTYLKQNGGKKGVITTDSGLQYQVVEKGSGDRPKLTDTVTVHYTGTLTDGTVFDSSRERGEPATFPVNGVIPGWVEALQLMKPGARYKLFIPPELAYGPQETGRIPPNSTLVFDVELIEIKKPS